MLAPWKKSYDQPRQHIKKQRHYFTNKGLSSQASGITLPELPLLRLSLQIETHPSSLGHATLWADGILVP